MVAGCILWPQLTARTLCVGVTPSLHTAERHAQKDGTGSGFHSAFLYRTRGVALSQVRGRATSGCEYRGGRIVGVGSLTGLTQRSGGKSTAKFREGCQCIESRADQEQGSRPMVVYSILLLLQCHPEQTGTQSQTSVWIKNNN